MPSSPRASPVPTGGLAESRPRALTASAPILAMIGNTPLLPLSFVPEGLTLHAKCEFANPSGSIKDRFALCALADAKQRGQLRSDSIVLECTSGNTGVSLALIGAALGHRVRLVMPRSASIERQQLVRHYGAELQLYDADFDRGILLVENLAAKDARFFLPRQFTNPLNARDHEENTAMEIIGQMGGEVDAFVCGFGSGATLCGIGRALRHHHAAVRIVAMEQERAGGWSHDAPRSRPIEGLAGSWRPPLLDDFATDGCESVSRTQAIAMARRLAREFGLPVGISSGANVVAALRVATRLPRGARIVTMLFDRAERYYSTPLFARPATRRLSVSTISPILAR